MPLGAARLNTLARYIADAAEGGGSIVYRTDAYASSVFLALPFDETNELNDVSPSINGSSTQATLTSGANSTVTNAEVYWSTPSYGKALENVATGGTQSMAYGLSTSIPAASSGTFVIEGWFLASSSTSNANWCISSGDSGGRFLFGINNGSSFSFANENNIGIGSGWHHLAIVCDSGTKRFYYDGIYKGAWVSSNSGFSTIHIGQFNAGDNNDYQGHIQDFKVTIGSNRGYTGTSNNSANFTIPESMVETFASGGEAPAGRTAVNVTAYGNAQIDNTTYNVGSGSVVLDGTGDYLATDFAHPDMTEFTFECWFRLSSLKDNMFIWQGDNGVSDSRHQIWITGPSRSTHSNEVIVATGSGGSYTFNVNFGSTTWATNTWYHLAVTRNSSNSITVWVNGVSKGSATDSKAFFSSSATPLIGSSAYNATAGDFPGYLDEIRISDTARYNTNFTPDTAGFGDDANTLMLLHLDTDFSDDTADGGGAPEGEAPAGRTAVNVTANGDVQVDTAQSKFGGASALFDGNNDYLTVESIDDSATDLTYEAWVRFNINPESQTIGGGSYMMLATVSSNSYIMCQEKNGEKQVQIADSSTYIAFTESGGGGWNTNQWYHVAVVRNADQYDAYVDGVSLPRPATSTKTGGFISGNAHTIGRFVDSRGSWGGYIDELRISDTARYNTNFTPDSTAFANDANTLLLLHMDGADGDTTFTDDTADGGGAPGAPAGRTAKTVTVFGNSQIDTAQSKFGGASLYVDGSGDYLSVADDADFNFSDDFTMECWARLDGSNPDFDHILGTWSNGNSLRQNFVGLDGGNKPVVYYMNGSSIQTDIIGSSSLTTGNWYHIAWVGDSTNQRYYINGTKVDETSQRYYSQDAANAFTIGADTGGSNPFNGWIDEVRVSNTARYNTNFTPDSTAFANDTDTVLLLHMDGADGDTTFTDDNA